MEMINEVSAIMQNKNMFNKIISAIKKYKDINAQKDAVFYMNEENYKARMTMRFSFELLGVELVEASDWIYVCANVKAVPKKVWNSYSGSTIDPAAEYLRNVLKYKPGNDWRSAPEDVVRSVENATNLKCGIEYDVPELQKTKAYKLLNESLSDMMSMKYDLILRDDVHKRLKKRKNTIPLAYYKTVEDDFNFPSDILPYGSPMATSCRSDFTLDYVVKNVRSVSDSIAKYTPWKQWTIVDFGVASRYLNLNLSMVNQ